MNLTSTRALAAAFGMAAVAVVGVAAPAHADPPPFSGIYVVANGDPGLFWTVSSDCVSDGCTANVVSNRGWNSVATMTGGKWVFTVSKPDAVICDDGNYAPATMGFSVDPVTLDGTMSSDSNEGCPGGLVSQMPFNLAKIA
jgi:hypothetical protein